MKKIRLPFNIEEYKKGVYKVVTRDNLKVRIGYIDSEYCFIVGTVLDSEQDEKTLHYNKDGKYLLDKDSTYDLFLTKTEFEDGDIISINYLRYSSQHHTILIFKENNLPQIHFLTYYCLYDRNDDGYSCYDDKFGYIKVNISDMKDIQLASEEDKKRLFLEIKEHGQRWNYEENKIQFLFSAKPFDKVLVRNNKNEKWNIESFGLYDKDTEAFTCTGGVTFNYCIPYNNETNNLLGVNKECNEKYQNLIIL